MKLLTLLLIHSLFIFQAFAGSKTLYQGKKAYILYLEDEVWVSEHCRKDCLAIKAPKEKKPSHSSQPAADFCQNAKGTYLVAKDSMGIPEGLCQFTDGSYILAWDFYKKFKTK